MQLYYDRDIYQKAKSFHSGDNYRSYDFLGSHPYQDDNFDGVSFTVWAPNASSVNLIGDFNDWNEENIPLQKVEDTGIWQVVLGGVEVFDTYKYLIHTPSGEKRYKADPFSYHAEERPKTGSKYYDIEGYNWQDEKWLAKKENQDIYNEPMNIYEVSILSWKKNPDGSQYSYRQFADEAIGYVKSMGYTHIELMGILEHPYDGSWGYQVTGFYAPTSRFGTPKDFMYLVDKCHQMDIGVIIDWVPVHFPKDDHGLARFDGSYLFEAYDQHRAINKTWDSLNFDYNKSEVRSFMVSNAIYWLDKYHIDGIRADAIAYLMYYDYDTDYRSENHDGINFLRDLNTAVFRDFPKALMIAEDSTDKPLVTSPVDQGGIGFNFKWSMGWMNDILEYMELDPIYRKDHHDELRFSFTYWNAENYILPLSHDEVVHGKKSLVDKMPGSYEEKFASYRLLLGFMIGHPGKKLNFMGGEFAQFIEWDEWGQLDWFLLDYPSHSGFSTYVSELNHLYLSESSLWDNETSWDSLEWIEHDNANESILIFERVSINGDRLICLYNFTPVRRQMYPVGVKEKGRYRTLMSSDRKRYGGDTKRVKTYFAKDQPSHGRYYSIEVDLPPLSCQFIKISK